MLVCVFENDSIGVSRDPLAHVEFGLVLKIAKAHLSQRKIVYITKTFVHLISVVATEHSKHWISTGMNCAKVSCDATDFEDDGCWIS